ncbi:MAG: DMT family transporter, partial [Bacteroidia bacterium]|nr:DMT family transporter [Bacteroidia bacterium]
MPELSIQNIERVTSDVKKQEIVFSHLFDELIDHICCDIENEMQDGLTFYEAYNKVKQKMGSRRLKEIQEETLYAVDTKYRNMKNIMKISGVTGTVLSGFAALFKIQHWPGAGAMMTLGAAILAFVFLPSALGVLWKETHNKNRLLLFISAFLSGMFFILGILFKVQHWSGAGTLLMLATAIGILCFIPALVINRFRDQEDKIKRPVYILGASGFTFYVAGLFCKIQHWPGATLLMVVGLITLCIIAFPWYTWLSWKDERHINSKFLFMVIGTLAIIIPGAMFNLTLQYAYEDGFYPHQEQQQAMCNYLYSKNNYLMNRYRDSMNYKGMEELHSKTNNLFALISNIQLKMVQESEGKPGKPAVSADKIVQTAEYANYISGLEKDAEIQAYKSLLNPATYLPGNDRGVPPVSLMSGLHSLELLKNGLLTIE